MSFTITTDVFCDFCHDWTEGQSGLMVLKRDAWLRAKSNGWKKLADGKHCCPSCLNKGEYRKKKHWVK